MDGYLSGEELLIKTRKPYTITKQRERWTEEEHNRFLEALKLHGRAWQRIEEHIGTKTAVQIRSHAQKFFSKLEKEALVKGVSVGQSIDLEIPPPRPKRKPSNPYPRKTGSGCSPNSQVKANDGNQSPSCSPHSAKQGLDLEKEPQSEKNGGDDEQQNPKGTSGGGRCAQDFAVFPDASSSLGTSSKEIPSTATESARKLPNLKESVPAKKPLVNEERSESHVDNGAAIYQKPDKPDYTETIQNNSKNKMHTAAKSFPRHAPVQILDGSQATCSQGLSSDVSYQEPRVKMDITGQSSMFGNPAVSAAVESPNSTSRSSNHNVYPTFNPLPSNEQDYNSFFQMSSTFSSMIVSALLQNPAAHAAACFSASLWPSPNTGNGFAPPAPSMEAIAAATIAAATAWWAAHGLLPCAPFQPALVPVTYGNVGQVRQSEPEQSEALLQRQHSVSNSENSGEKMDIEVAATNVEEAPSICEEKDVNKGNKKQVDRSSCGSNTPSGSDVETDALGKNDNGNEEANDPDVNNNTSDLNGRRIRFVGNNITDNWKEVSEEGRLAFKALFSKGRLPQSFLPSHNFTSKVQNTEQGNNEEAPQFDLNRKAWETVLSDQSIEQTGDLDQSYVKNIDGELRIGLPQGKLTSGRTGFKPYKRCSDESRENTLTNSGNSEQGNCSKRLRLEESSSI